MKQPLFLKPVFQERIWGGTLLRDKYGYEISSEKTGECWGISGHPNGNTIVKNGKFTGKTIQYLWSNAPELFGYLNSPAFPLLIKILDANDDLSVQVHPDDAYASRYENGELGKTECWYIIECEENAEIVYGHNANSKEELFQKINNHEWNSLLHRIKIKPGDFFYIPSGTVHAICKGTLILEVQQSSDTTYRVYDYNRIDEKRKKRELHLKKALDVITVPNKSIKVNKEITETSEYTLINYIKSDYFFVYKWEIRKKVTLSQDKSFMLCSVIDGSGTLNNSSCDYDIVKGDHFILPYRFGEFTISGNLEIIMTHL